VTRRGENQQLDGRPYAFVGTNVSYLAGPFFPEEKMEEVISLLAAKSDKSQLGSMTVRQLENEKIEFGGRGSVE